MHAAIGWAAVLLAAVHAVAVQLVALRDDAGPLWLARQLLLGFVVALPGFWMAWTARRGDGHAMASAAALATVCLVEALAFRAGLPVLFAALSILDGVVLAALALRRRTRAAVVALVGFAAIAATGGARVIADVTAGLVED